MGSGAKKAAFITGGGKRLGAEIALDLARDGYDIALHYNSSENEAFEIQKRVRKFGRECTVFKGDLKDLGFVNEVMKAAFFSFPHLSVLVNSASVFKRAEIGNTTPELFNELFAVNLKAPFFLIKEFAKICSRGNIINILDTKTASCHNFYAAYSLSKHALQYLTRLAAAEYAPKIRSNGICPGLVMPAPGEDEEYVKRLEAKILLKKKGSAENITRTVRYILENDFLTGEIIYVDGGENLKI